MTLFKMCVKMSKKVIIFVTIPIPLMNSLQERDYYRLNAVVANVVNIFISISFSI